MGLIFDSPLGVACPENYHQMLQEEMNARTPVNLRAVSIADAFLWTGSKFGFRMWGECHRQELNAELEHGQQLPADQIDP